MSNEEMVRVIDSHLIEPPADDRPIRFCGCCETPLYEGDVVWEIGDEVYCDSCAKDNFKKILFR